MILLTSGTTGDSKNIFQPEKKLEAAATVALKAQYMDDKSRVLTVCRMNHVGGALAQTHPAQFIGAHVDIKKFNPFTFFEDIKGYTHTHLVPQHIDMLLKIHGIHFGKVDLEGVFITCGSDRVYKRQIRPFVERGATFMSNWGMTEVGPIAINTVFTCVKDIHRKIDWDDSHGDTLLGDECWLETDIQDDELLVKGDICVYPLWIKTGDLVEMREGKLIFKGRK
jgi:acyl-CoA synthetase (AMP-forming)/AMP-acid ligase II